MPDKVQFVENFVEVYVFNRALSTQHDEFLIGWRRPWKSSFIKSLWTGFTSPCHKVLCTASYPCSRSAASAPHGTATNNHSRYNVFSGNLTLNVVFTLGIARFSHFFPYSMLYSTSSYLKNLISVNLNFCFDCFKGTQTWNFFFWLFCRNRNHMVPRACNTRFLKIVFEVAEIFDF
jgi:hypothetical protein